MVRAIRSSWRYILLNLLLLYLPCVVILPAVGLRRFDSEAIGFFPILLPLVALQIQGWLPDLQPMVLWTILVGSLGLAAGASCAWHMRTSWFEMEKRHKLRQGFSVLLFLGSAGQGFAGLLIALTHT